jgi:hypothetical protein
MIEYSIARKEHLPMILELYKQLIPEEIPIDIDMANKIWEKIENNGIKYFIAIEYGKQINCYKIILQSSYKRKENHIFYEKCGFDGNSKRAFEIRFK